MKIHHFSYFEANGGAALATLRLHRAQQTEGIDSQVYTIVGSRNDPTVTSPNGSLTNLWHRLRARIGKDFTRLQQTDNPVLHSPALLPSSWPAKINRSNAGLVNLHWINNEMMSVEDIACIRKPVVWTLHDMWAFCGAEHVAWDERWKLGYKRENRPSHEHGFDLNRWVWQRKQRSWTKPLQVVTPSTWLADCVRQSALMRDWPVHVIPNPVDTSQWYPERPEVVRPRWALRIDTPVLAFASSGIKVHHKGLDLLEATLLQLIDRIPELQIIYFGDPLPTESPLNRCKPRWLGYLHSIDELRSAYNAADVFILPSRTDNLPNTGLEALACGTPIAAFHTAGLPDIVRHQQTGYLARPFDSAELSAGIAWILQHITSLSQAARTEAEQRFAPRTIARQYQELYARVINDHKADL